MKFKIETFIVSRSTHISTPKKSKDFGPFDSQKEEKSIAKECTRRFPAKV